MRTLSGLLLVLLVGPCLAGEAPEEEGYNIQAAGWSYSRERKTITSSNRVTVTFTLKNVSKAPISDIAVTVSFNTGLGEKAATPITKKIGQIKAGDTEKVTAVGDFVPAFSAYGIVVQYGGTREEWFSSSDTGKPQPKSKAPVEGTASIVVLGREVTPDRSGRFTGVVRVKNEGTAEAKNLKITIQFFDTKKQKIHEWSGKLGAGTLGGGAEANIPFACPNAPRMYGGYEIKVGCDDVPAEQALAGGDFANAEEVEFAKIVLKRSDPKSPDLRVAGQVRNGFKAAVSQVKLTVTFFGPKKKELKKQTYEVPGQLQPGEVKPVEFTVAGVPSFEGFEPAVAYEKVDQAPSPAATGKIEAAKFKNLKEVEVIFTDTVPNDDKSVSLAGAVRNGKSTAVKDIVVTVEFTKAGGKVLTTAEKTITDVVRSGEERNFVIKAANAAGFADYSFKFKYAEAQ
ncbi:MAG: hypothetical protein NTW87_15160 [Planctomycetota bacterium]|nr:hypothetical protein [Planctomycetota bacterium]